MEHLGALEELLAELGLHLDPYHMVPLGKKQALMLRKSVAPFSADRLKFLEKTDDFDGDAWLDAPFYMISKEPATWRWPRKDDRERKDLLSLLRNAGAEQDGWVFGGPTCLSGECCV